MSLNFENLTPDERTFYDTLKDAGMKLEDAELRAEFSQMADDASLTISNNSAYSPFWCFVTAAVTTPARWLAAFVVRRIMPGLYVKTAGGLLLELLADGYDVKRKSAVAMQGYLTFNRAAADAGETVLTIPAGTVVRSVPLGGVIYRMITAAEAVIPAGGRSVRVLAVAEKPGAAYNLGATYYSIIDGNINSGMTVTNTVDYLAVPGADEETDEELRLRLRNHFTAVSQWHTDAKYKALIASREGFRVDQLFFVHDAPRGPGTANCYALFDAPVSPAKYLADVNDYITKQDNHGHGDDLVVYAVPDRYYVIRLTVTLRSSLTVDARAALIEKIETLIRCAFRLNSDYAEAVTQTWPYSWFSFSKLDYELHSQFSAIVSLGWEYRPATQQEAATGQYDESAGGWTVGDIKSELDVPRLLKLIINEVEP